METTIPCKICGNTAHNHRFTATERLLNMHDTFEYLECAACNAIHIIETPANLADYYPSGYYSFREPGFERQLKPLLSFLKQSLIKHYLFRNNLIGAILSIFLPHPFPWFKPGMVSLNSSILDIGTGSGRKLISMQRSGFRNLTGIDPFLENDLKNSVELKILKKDLFSMEGQFDVVMMHHSFEHMDHPEKVLAKIAGLIKPDGKVIIRIPVANCYAWRKYKTYWFALDAPRHLFLHTPQSIRMLAERTGLKMDNITFDSSFNQFASSEKYLRGLPYSDDFSAFDKKQLKYFAKEAARLNTIGDGDCACFYLSKR